MKRAKSRRKKKFRLLLDSAFAKATLFPKIAKKANIVHGVYDLGLSRESEDSVIYQKAIQENRFVLTINLKDFKKLIRPGKSGVIGIDSQLTNDQIDEIVSKFLSGKDPKDYLGKAVKIYLALKR